MDTIDKLAAAVAEGAGPHADRHADRHDLEGSFVTEGVAAARDLGQLAVDRMIRDLRASLYHPYPPDTAALHAGQHRLGLPLDPV